MNALRLIPFLALLLSTALLSPSSFAQGQDPVPLESFVVVIDPGHGGDDSGAIGPGNVLEKDVTLGVARRLAEELAEKGAFRVVLTRSDDTFVSLRERTAFANSVEADAFISIHANAAYRKKASGIETFFLSFEATDEDAARVAAIENSIGTEEALGAGEAAGDLKAILFDLADTRSRQESSLLAESVQTSLVGKIRGEDRGVKQAPFVVLSGAAMPAILVEVGFISNPGEEKRLTNGKEQARIAASIADGVAAYLKNLTVGRAYNGFGQAFQKKD